MVINTALITSFVLDNVRDRLGAADALRSQSRSGIASFARCPGDVAFSLRDPGDL